MTAFGDLLRRYRSRCNDPDHPARRLSQQRLGQLVGDELRLRAGYSGAAVSDWEKGKSRISANDRLVLIGLIKVLHRCGGIKSPAEADELLESGNYRALSREERKTLFGEGASESRQIPVSRFVLERVFFDSPDELQKWLAFVEEGPPPVWPRLITALLRRLSDRLSVPGALRALIWLWIWIIEYALIAPSMHWPFLNRETALAAIGLYVCGSLVLPLFIGSLSNTTKNTFWQGNRGAAPVILRLYVYQGAFIGFHLGYFAVFAVNLALFFFQTRFAAGLQFVLLGIPLLTGYMAGQVVPYNVWRAYGRLHPKDGAVFFVFPLLGPLWGWFFTESHPLLLTPFTGILVVLSALTLLVGMTARQFHRTK